MKKRIIFAIGGLAVAIVGAGVLGGTYNSYSNYQKLNSLSGYYTNITVSYWNSLSTDYRNKIVSGTQEALNNNSTSSFDQSNLKTLASLDPNSNADQGGVIGGSIVLVIGLIILIASLVVKRKKVNN